MSETHDETEDTGVIPTLPEEHIDNPLETSVDDHASKETWYTWLDTDLEPIMSDEMDEFLANLEVDSLEALVQPVRQLATPWTYASKHYADKLWQAVAHAVYYRCLTNNLEISWDGYDEYERSKSPTLAGITDETTVEPEEDIRDVRGRGPAIFEDQEENDESSDDEEEDEEELEKGAPVTDAFTASKTTVTTSNLTTEKKAKLAELEALLIEVNGNDAYSVTALNLGALKRDEFLVLPDNLLKTLTKTPAKNVGDPWDPNNSRITTMDFINIYAMNKAVGSETKNDVLFALIRAEAVKMGWWDNQKEVRFDVPPVNSVEVYLKDSESIKDGLSVARTAAYLIPMMTENVFRTTGHHYLTGMADDYERKYAALCNACLVSDITSILRASETWHKVLHWVSPARAREVVVTNIDGPKVPHALKIRANAAPAGTAIVTTTVAVIDALEACNWADEVKKYGGYDFDKIRKTADKIKSNVTKYHNAYFAYNVSGPSISEKRALEVAVLEAQKFAPIAQGFIDAMYSDSSLGKAKALKKHAEASPALMRRAVRVFRALTKSDTNSIKDIFVMTTD